MPDSDTFRWRNVRFLRGLRLCWQFCRSIRRVEGRQTLDHGQVHHLHIGHLLLVDDDLRLARLLLRRLGIEHRDRLQQCVRSGALPGEEGRRRLLCFARGKGRKTAL